MIKFDNNDYVKNLPDCYDKQSGSNNEKLLSIERYAHDELKTDMQDVFDVLDIQNASGKTLDLYGEMIGQPRGEATNEQFVLMIMSKVMRNLSTGDYNSVLKSIYMTLNCDPSDISIVETETPATIKVVKLPLAVISKANLTTSQTAKLIEQLLPVGVTLETFLFEGTFEFDANEGVQDNDKGFADDDGTIGGYLGVVYGEENETTLPI